MIDIEQAAKFAEEDVLAVQTWVSTEYSKHFAEYFDDIHHLSTAMASNVTPITDDELESILVDLPLKLFSAAEQINRVTLNLEVMKLKNKKAVTEKIQKSITKIADLLLDISRISFYNDIKRIAEIYTIIGS